MARSMDWKLEDNIVDGLLFCATLTNRRGGLTSFVQTGAEAVKPDPDSSWEGQSMGVGAGVRDESAESCGIVHHTACHW